MASPRRKSSKRRSTKRRSPKQTSWTRKLQAWRKANAKKDGSLPSMKRAMKACKGKSAKRSKCRSPKRSSKRRTSKKRSSKRRTSKKRSSKRRTSKKRSSKRRTSKKRSSKRRTSKKRSPYTRKLKSYYPDFIGKRVEVFHRPKPVFAPAPSPAPAPAPVTQQGPVFGPQTAQQYELRTGKRADGLVIGPQTAQQYELRTGKRADGLVIGPQTRQDYEKRTGKRADGLVIGPQTRQDYELRTGKRADGLVIGPQTRQDYELRTGKPVWLNTSKSLPQWLQNSQQSQQDPVVGPQTAQQYELRTGKRADGLVIGPQTFQEYDSRTKERVIDQDEHDIMRYAKKDIERTINNPEITASKRQLYTEMAIRHMLYDLYKIARTEDLSHLPPAQTTFSMIVDFIEHNRKPYELFKIGGWKYVDYQLLKELMNVYPQKDVKWYWDDSFRRYYVMWYALVQHDKKAITWLLNNMSYTDKDIQDLIINNDDRFIPGYKELLKPSIIGSITNLIGGFFG